MISIIYTTYFGKLKKLPNNVFPIAICGKSPDWYKGAKYKMLAPKYNFFMEWKNNHDNEYYTEHFNSEVLGALSVQDVLNDLHKLVISKVPADKICENICRSKDYHIALICYEKPGDFCHRHLVAKWLREHGVDCTELEYKN